MSIKKVIPEIFGLAQSIDKVVRPELGSDKFHLIFPTKFLKLSSKYKNYLPLMIRYYWCECQLGFVSDLPHPHWIIPFSDELRRLSNDLTYLKSF